jgi:GNAT superfamily N-acetyltransferase
VRREPAANDTRPEESTDFGFSVPAGAQDWSRVESERAVEPGSDGVVTIRAPGPGDGAVLIAGRDELFYRFLGAGAADPRPAACIEAGGEVVGWVDYDTDRLWLGSGEVNIGYNVLPAHRGKGYAIRAVLLFLRYLARYTVHQTATVLIDPANAASLAVARRSSFVPAGQVEGSLFLKRPVDLSHCE